jgi:hypothetical protein
VQPHGPDLPGGATSYTTRGLWGAKGRA